MRNIRQRLNALEKLNFDMYRKDFLLTADKSQDDLEAVIGLAEVIEGLYRNNISARAFQSGLAVSIFRDQSTRTRFSFASATNLLGLALNEFDESKSQVTHGETLRETANMISFLTEAIGIRDDMYIGKGNAYMREVGDALDEGFEEGVLNHRPAIVNLQCDIDHPTQSMSDLAHMKNYFGGDLENLRGKKIAMTWAYSPSYGKPLSVPQGIITLMSRYGMEVHLAHPEGYDLMDETIEQAKNFSKETGGSFKVSNSMEDAFKDADVVYPKSWAPFAVMDQRTKIIDQGADQVALDELEKECLNTNAKYTNWECDADMMKLTKGGNALYMHCLPADISGVSCEEGEVSADVFEKNRINTYVEARYKPFVIAAMILASRFRDPVALMDSFYRKRNRRSGSFSV
ncbi:MAG: knotted carbamoyltransferase YgeW [Elusimicrobia bacterium]|nr:knotted carbamoyltransferase YgeW [Elusimicrobiota bacterium]